MLDPVQFKNPALGSYLAIARQSLARLPAAKQQPALQATIDALRTLDATDDLSIDELRAAAAKAVVNSQLPAGLDLAPPQTTVAAPKVRPLALVPGATIDASDSMPLLHGARPSDWPQLADAMYGLAATIDRSRRGNPFDGLNAKQKQALLDRLVETFDGKTFAAKRDDLLTDQQAAQLRSSTATVMRTLIDALVHDDSPLGHKQLERGVREAARVARTETVPVLRDSMAFGLYRLQTRLPEELRPITRELMRDVAPLVPSYDAWLTDGKIVVDLIVDGDAATLGGTRGDLEGQGFKRVGSSLVMRGTFGTGDKAALVEVRVRSRSYSHDVFKNITKDDVDIVWYTGHSSYGRNFPRSLKNAPTHTGKDKLVVFDTCYGKDNMQQVRQQYPQAELLATFNSSDYGDSMNAMRAMWKGIGARSPWKTISEDIGDNWITPAATMIRRRILDRDGDGRADVFDRLFDVNLQRVDDNLRRAFQPVEPEGEPHRLNSLYGVVAANWLNRGASGYNAPMHDRNDNSRVSAAGFFNGAPGDPPIRFEEIQHEDGETGWALSINHRFGHMPEEVLRAVATFELNRFWCDTDPAYAFHDDPLRARVNGLMAVAWTLDHDLSSNDSRVWTELLKAYNLPADIDRYDIARAAAKHAKSWMDNDAGSRAAVDDYIAKLTKDEPKLLAKLKAADAGRWPSPASAARAGLPDQLYLSLGTRVINSPDPGGFYCSHLFYLANKDPGPAIARNPEGEPLVGIFHILRKPKPKAETPIERHPAEIDVLARAVRSYVRDAFRATGDSPARLLLTGFGVWGEVSYNPTADLATSRAKIDAIMAAAFGDRLRTPEGREKTPEVGKGVLLEYEIFDPVTRSTRTLSIRGASLPVNDDALNPDKPGSLPSLVANFAPHAILAMGVGNADRKAFHVESLADNDGLAGYSHDEDAPITDTLPRNYSLARAIHHP